MRAFAILFHKRRYLAHSRPAKLPEKGWRALRWSNLEDTEKFGSREAAELFLRVTPHLHNPDVEIVELGSVTGRVA